MVILETKLLHGFRSEPSTETALLEITNKIYDDIVNHQINLLTLSGLTKAFDIVKQTNKKKNEYMQVQKSLN